MMIHTITSAAQALYDEPGAPHELVVGHPGRADDVVRFTVHPGPDYEDYDEAVEVVTGQIEGILWDERLAAEAEASTEWFVADDEQ